MKHQVIKELNSKFLQKFASTFLLLFLYLLVGPSSDPYGLSIVDSIKVYVQSKELFGFFEETVGEKAQEQVMTEPTLPAHNNALHSSSEQ